MPCPDVNSITETADVGAAAEAVTRWISGFGGVGGRPGSFSVPQLVLLQRDDPLLPDSRDQRKRAKKPRQRVRAVETDGSRGSRGGEGGGCRGGGGETTVKGGV